MKKKTVSFLLATVLTAAMITGCGGSGDKGAKDAEDGKVTLSYMNHTGEEKTIAYEDKLIAEFEEKNPDINVEVQRMSMDDYTQTIQTKIASGDAPDVFMIEQSNLEKYAKNQYLQDLSDTDIVNHYDGNMLSYDGKLYGAPLNVNAYVVTYNKELFEKVGAEIPDTLDEFYKVCEKIKEAGYAPLAAGYQDSWVLMADTQAEYATSIMADDLDALKKCERREVKFADSKEWREVFERIGKRLQYTQEDQFGTDWNTACTMLANGEAAMVVSGDWTSNNVADMGETVELGAFVLPVSNNAEDSILAYPGAGQSYAVSADSENQEAAVKFVDFMTTKESGEAYVNEGIGICVIKDVVAPETETALSDIITLINEGKSKALPADTDFNFSEEYRDAFQNVVSDFLLNGGKDVDQVLKDMDTEFDRIAEN